MIIDKQARFEWDNTLTDTRVSTDKYDAGAANRDLGLLDRLYLVGVVTAPIIRAAGAMTVQCQLVGDDNASLTTPTVLEELMAATSKATLVAGYVMFKKRLPIEKITERYLGLQWTCSAAGDSGTVRVFLTPNVDRFFAVYHPRRSAERKSTGSAAYGASRSPRSRTPRR